MQKRTVLNSPRLLELKKKRRKTSRNKILITFGFILVILVLLVYVSRLKILNIYTIEITGNKVVDTQAMRTLVQRDLAGKYFLLFPKTNILFYPEGKIKNDLQNTFERLETVDLSVKNNTTLQISVTERTPMYTWCGQMPPTDTTIQDTCYFVDGNGYIFDQAPYFSGQVYFKFYGDPNVNPSSPAGSYFGNKDFKQLVAFRDMLTSIGLKPVSLYLTTNGVVQVNLSGTNPSVPGPEILALDGADFENVTENLEAALTTAPLQSEFNTQYVNLEYIDLRYGNKVYYKFSTPATTTQATLTQ